MTQSVKVLLIANVVLFFVQLLVDTFTRGKYSYTLGLSRDLLLSGYVWQLVTYMFLHGGPLHLFFNMLVLYFIGPETERIMGRRHFLTLYFASGMLGGLGWVLIGSWGLCVGASGAIFGLLGAFATMFPQRRMTLLLFFIIPVTMKAWVLVTSLALIELAFLLGGSGANIAYAVHLGGVLVGASYAWIVMRNGGRLKRRRPPRLRVIQGGRNAEYSPAEVDRILEKIASQGIQSLTSRERATLESASGQG